MKVLYRIVNALLGIAVFPITFFCSLLTVQLTAGKSIEGIASLIGMFTDKINTDNLANYVLVMNFSIKDAVFKTGDMAMLGDGDFSVKELYANPALDPIRTKLIVFVAAVAVALLAGLVLFIFSCSTNKKLPCLIDSVIGLASVITANAVFSKIALAFTSGKVNIASLLPADFGGDLGGFLFSAVEINPTIGVFTTFLILAFGAAIIWTLCYYVTDIGAQDEVKTKKAKK